MRQLRANIVEAVNHPAGTVDLNHDRLRGIVLHLQQLVESLTDGFVVAAPWALALVEWADDRDDGDAVVCVLNGLNVETHIVGEHLCHVVVDRIGIETCQLLRLPVIEILQRVGAHLP